MSAPDPAAVVAQYRDLSQQYIRARLLSHGSRRADKMFKLQGQMLDAEEAMTADGLEALSKALGAEHSAAIQIVSFLTGTDGEPATPEGQFLWLLQKYPERRESVAAAAVTAAEGAR